MLEYQAMVERLRAAAHRRFFWLIVSLVLSVLLAVANLFAIQYFLYWRFWWFDIPMHIGGGFVIGSLLIGVFDVKRPLMFLASVLAMSVGWEIMEYLGGLTRFERGYVFDTAHDLLDDTIGATLAYMGARLTIWR